MLEVHVDVEMTGLTMKSDTISFGMICEKENVTHTLYCEIIDFDKNTIEDDGKDFIYNNVIGNLLMNNIYSLSTTKNFTLDNNKQVISTVVKSSKEDVAEQTADWLNSLGGDIMFIADCCSYDACHIFELWGGAFKIPECVCPVMYDINQDIARAHNVDIREAFDMSREKLAENYDSTILELVVKGIANAVKVLSDTDTTNISAKFKHNALYDVFLSKYIYETISK